MKAEFINPVLKASQIIIKNILNLDFKLGELKLVKANSFEDRLVIMIWMNGDYEGRFMFTMSRETACKIASGMIGEEIKMLDAFSKSAIGELANIILGRVGIIYENQGHNVNISPPSILEGDTLFIQRLSSKISKNTILDIPLIFEENYSIGLRIEDGKVSKSL